MSLSQRLPPSILGGDPFNQFRFLYRRDLLWKLFDEEYCLSVMRAYSDAGGKGFDLSFPENARLFKRLLIETNEPLTGFGNPSWEQGVFLNGRYLQYSRDRILRTLVDRFFPRQLAEQVRSKLSYEDVLVFGYDREAEPLTDREIEGIYLDVKVFEQRLSIFKDCQYIFLGGSDADWLVSLGRIDIIQKMAEITRMLGFIPLLLCQYATHVVPILEAARVDIDGYCLPINKEWSWFDRDACVDIIHGLHKPVVAFMPLAGGSLKANVPTALEWLYCDVGVESILFGTASPHHAVQTAQIANAARNRSDLTRNSVMKNQRGK